MTRSLRAAVVATLAVAALSACGSDTDSVSTAADQESGSATAETESDSDADSDSDAEIDSDEPSEDGVCPEDAEAVDVPAEVADIPIPDGVVIYDVETREGTGTILTAVSPQALSEVLAAMNAAYSADGYEITDGETEERDAEANWTNADVRGRWAIRDLAGSCDSGTQVQILVTE